jgi:Niemann-Pick C1 protein
MYNYLSIGPPVYFVIKSPYNYSDHILQERIRAGSNPSSLVSQIFSASKLSNKTLIASPTSSWMDDYIDWAGNENCCKFNKSDGSFCPNTASLRHCSKCEIEIRDDFLSNQDFVHYLSFFLRDNPNEDCPKGGHAAYGQAVEQDSIAGASYFMTYHSILKTSQVGILIHLIYFDVI